MLFSPYDNEPFTDFGVPANADAYRQALEEARAGLGRDWPLVIGGERIVTGSWLESHDPGDAATLVGRAAAAGPAEINRAFAAAEGAFPGWAGLAMADRSRALMRLAAVLRRHKAELSAYLTLESGKNWAEADADVAEAIDFVEYYARDALNLVAPVHAAGLPGEENTTTLRPMGTGVAIPPWNFPLAILVGTAIGPVAVGNTIIVKPSPNTPVIAGKFMECLDEAGFPPGVVNLLTGTDADLGDALVDDARTRFINFTGSVGIGLRIHERAARPAPGQNFIKKVYAEMGGKDAMIVDETADLEAAAAAAVASAFGFQGQKCSALSRLVVVDAVHDQLLDLVVERAAALEVGPAAGNFPVGPVINERQFEKILEYIGIGRDEGRVVLGGERARDGGWYIKPTIIADVAPDARVASEEIFGPVLAVVRARDFDHALEIVNDSPYALTGGVFSNDRHRLARARAEYQAGNLYINRKITGALVGVQPFGGFKLSGDNAKAGGPEYLRLFMIATTVTERF